MEFKALRVFIEVARQGGFSKAANTLFSTQSTVSKAIKQLEEDLGFLLLQRFKTHNSLTAAGDIVYRRGIKLLAERDDLLNELDEIRGLKQGRVRLGISPVGSNVLFAPLFARYSKLYPGIEVELVEHGSDKLAELLQAGDIDFAGTLLPVPDEFEYQALRSEPLVALLNSSHPLSKSDSISLSDLKEVPFILFGSGFSLHRLILDACHSAGFEPKVVAQSSQIDFMLELVAAGLGVTFLPRMVAQQRFSAKVHSVLLNESELHWNMAMTWRRNSYLSEAAKAWLMLVQEFYTQ